MNMIFNILSLLLFYMLMLGMILNNQLAYLK